MTTKRLIKRFLATLPLPIRRLRTVFLQIGAETRLIPVRSHLLFDIKRRLKHEQIEVIFDIGANVGQSVLELRIEFPHARILSFEPDPDTFKKLQKNTMKINDVELFNLAFGRHLETLRFDNTSSITEMHRIAADQQNPSFPLVQVCTLDDFCRNRRIDGIDYLKIDTEGHDFEVLHGAEDLLVRGAIKIVTVECSMCAVNKFHKSFADYQTYLESLGYRIFGVYDQMGWPDLRYANSAYISQSVCARNQYTQP